VVLAIYLWPGKKVEGPPAKGLAETSAPSKAVDSLVSEPIKRSPKKAVSPGLNAAPKTVRSKDFSLAAKQEPLADNPKRYTFTLSLRAPSEIVDDISRVHYDLVYDPNPLSLDGGAAPAFSAVYEGWGCYETVVVTAYFKSSGSQPVKKTFNMCTALN
jgi:hypothetical protein